MFEDQEWRNYFWSPLPTDASNSVKIPMASVLMTVLSDLLFCPDFTVEKLKTVCILVLFKFYFLLFRVQLKN